MTSTYTPGPWRIAPPIPDDRRWLIWPEIKGRGPVIAAVTNEADARLIAAAPDLLQALREILEDPDAKLLDTDREVGWEAIAKAEGPKP